MANPMAPTEMPAFWKGVSEPPLPAALAAAAAVVVLVSAAGRVPVDTDVPRVVSVALDTEEVVRVSECVSTTNVEGRPVVLDMLLVRVVLEGAGNDTGPAPEGGSNKVAVMTP